MLHVQNPMPRVPSSNVLAIHQGICAGTEADSVLPFYSLEAEGLGLQLPYWTSQTSSFSRAQMDKIVVHVARATRGRDLW